MIGLAIGAGSRSGFHPKDHDDIVFVDLNAFDQSADDVTLDVEIDRIQSFMDGSGEFFETIDDRE